MISNVFLGEIFSAIVSLHNQSDQILRDVILKVRLKNNCNRKKNEILFIFRQIFKQLHNGLL